MAETFTETCFQVCRDSLLTSLKYLLGKTDVCEDGQFKAENQLWEPHGIWDVVLAATCLQNQQPWACSSPPVSIAMEIKIIETGQIQPRNKGVIIIIFFLAMRGVNRWNNFNLGMRLKLRVSECIVFMPGMAVVLKDMQLPKKILWGLMEGALDDVGQETSLDINESVKPSTHLPTRAGDSPLWEDKKQRVQPNKGLK